MGSSSLVVQDFWTINSSIPVVEGHSKAPFWTPSDWSVDWCLLQVSWQSSQSFQKSRVKVPKYEAPPKASEVVRMSGSRCVDNFTQHIYQTTFTKLVDSIAPTNMCKEKNIKGWPLMTSNNHMTPSKWHERSGHQKFTFQSLKGSMLAISPA